MGLVGLGPPIAPRHQPEVGGLDPSHPSEGEGRLKALLGDRREGDGLRVSLVDRDAVGIVLGADGLLLHGTRSDD